MKNVTTKNTKNRSRTSSKAVFENILVSSNLATPTLKNLLEVILRGFLAYWGAKISIWDYFSIVRSRGSNLKVVGR